MLSRVVAWFTFAVVGLCALPLRAESPQNFAFELKFGPYKPQVDSSVKNGTPYKDIFGSNPFFFTQIEFDWQFWRKVGSFGLGFTLGYGRDKGKALTADGADKSADKAEFHILPLAIMLVYRFDYVAKRFNVPLVPYVKFGFDYYIWWTRTATGKIPVVDGKKGYGGTWGFHVNAGLAFLLDFFSPGTAKSFDAEVGVNHSYLFAELFYAKVNNFFRSRSIDLSDLTFTVGLAFEF